MNPAADPLVITILIGGLIAGAAALFLVPHPCQCKHCTYHLHERKVASEKHRAHRHRMLHHTYQIPWGDESCAQCNLGHENDRYSR